MARFGSVSKVPNRWHRLIWSLLGAASGVSDS
jgi:hypothetical protein